MREGKTKEEERKSEFEKHEEKWEELIFEVNESMGRGKEQK